MRHGDFDTEVIESSSEVGSEGDLWPILSCRCNGCGGPLFALLLSGLTLCVLSDEPQLNVAWFEDCRNWTRDCTPKWW